MKNVKISISILMTLCMLISITLPVLAVPQTRETLTVLLGDANKDGVVNTADATYILKYCADMLNITDTYRLIAADVDRNGKVNTADATFILRMCANNTPPTTITTEIPETTGEPTQTPTSEPTQAPTSEPTSSPTGTPEQSQTPFDTPDGKYQLVVSVYPENAAVVSVNGSNDLSPRFTEGEQVTLTAAKTTASDFVGWSINGNIVSTEYTYSFKMNGNTAVICRFGNEAWNGVSDTNYAGGNGTANSPYLIATAGQLSYLSDQIRLVTNYSVGKYFKLVNDIWLNPEGVVKKATSGVTSGLRTWTPIGMDAGTRGFCGTFDGDGHSIHGVFINSTNSTPANCGFFTALPDGSVVKNLNLVDCYIAKSTAGTLAGFSPLLNGKIENCTYSGIVRADSANIENVGGIAGRIDGTSSEINGCKFYGKVTGCGFNTGAIAGCGYINSRVTITNCINYGEVTSSEQGVAGIIGGLSTNTSGHLFQNCANYGNITSTALKNSACAGGIIGKAVNVGATIKGCVNTGNIHGAKYYVGGLIGEIYGNVSHPLLLENSYNAGAVSCDDNPTGKYLYVGAIAGQYSAFMASWVQYCVANNVYNIGTCTTNSMFGYQPDPVCVTVVNCCYLSGTLLDDPLTMPASADDIILRFGNLDAFTVNSNMNGGFPVLLWEVEGANNTDPGAVSETDTALYTVVFMNGNNLVSSKIVRAEDRVTLPAAESDKTGWSYGGVTYGGGAMFVMPMNDAFFSAV